MKNFSIKSEKELDLMAEGGKKLGEIKKRLASSIKVEGNADEIEQLAQKLIKEAGGEPSFAKVPSYSWATCINVNEGLVHGIPKKEVIFKKGDIVSIDIGMIFKGFHTDTSITVGVDINKELEKFLETGKEALRKAIGVCRPGNHIFDISKAIQETIEKEGYSSIRALVGHGIGKSLHEEPAIPCFVPKDTKNNLEIKPGMALAIEVMYTHGDPEIEIGKDGWTISMADGKISALFEETVGIYSDRSLVLTA